MVLDNNVFKTSSKALKNMTLTLMILLIKLKRYTINQDQTSNLFKKLMILFKN